MCISAKLLLAQECTFEQIYPYNAYLSANERIYRTINKEFICMTYDCFDTSANRSCAGGSFVNQILRVDSCGIVKWDKRINLTYGSISNAGIIETKTEDIILIGINQLSGLHIIKLSKEGDVLYEKRLLNMPAPGSTIYFNSITSINNITKQSKNNYLIAGNLTSYADEGRYSKPFILKIDENGNLLKINSYTQNFKWNNIVDPFIPNSALRFVSKLNDTAYYFVAQVRDVHIDSSITNLPANYWDLAVVFIDSNLDVKSYYNLTDLTNENVLPHINRGTTFEEIRPVNDSVIFIMGESMFSDFKGPPPVNRLLRGSAFLSVNERKFISRKKYELGEDYLYPLLFKENLVSLYNVPKEGGYILRDKNINTVKSIKTNIPQKFHVYPETPGFPTTNTLSAAFLTDDYSIVALGTSTFRKVKASYEDSVILRSEFAHEFYIIKIDSNGNFTPTTWNSVKSINKNTPRITIYPNPANEQLNILLPEGMFNIEVYDLRGKLITKLDNVNYKTDINTQQLSEGLYLLKAINHASGITQTQKFVIKR